MGILRSTSNFALRIVDYATRSWHTYEHANWDLLDGILSGLTAGNVPFAVATGSVDAYEATYDSVTAYTSGLRVAFKTNAANTGAATLNVNGLGAKSIKRLGVDLTAGQLPADTYVEVIYDGTNFNVIQPFINEITFDDGSVTPAKLSEGGPVWDTSGNLSTEGNFSATGNIVGNTVKEVDKRVLSHASNTYASGSVTFSTDDPSGGSDGDIWFKYS